MHILQVTAALSGGAGQVAWDLAQAYGARGRRSRLMVGFDAQSPESRQPNRSETGIEVQWIPHTVSGSPWSRLCWRTARHLGDRSRAGAWLRRLAQPANVWAWWRGREQLHFPGTWRLLEPPAQRPDLLHCHNLHLNYFDLRALPFLSRQVPTVLTLHDAWLLSGHCAHSLDCERWQVGCGQCPDLSLYPAIRRDATAFNWQRKQAIYRESRLHVVTPSRWLMDKVQRSILAEGLGLARVIPNGVDRRIFRPRDRARARAELGIPPDARVLLFTADGIRQNPWKDYRSLRAAVAAVAQRVPAPVLFLALGESAADEAVGSARVRFVPFTRDRQQVARHYQAADVYVHAARADTFPNTILEALACGTPVVATAVGGIPEQVEHGQTGFLAPPGDVASLASHLETLLTDPSLGAQMADRAHRSAARRFDLTQQADAYLAFYAEACNNLGTIA